MEWKRSNNDSTSIVKREPQNSGKREDRMGRKKEAKISIQKKGEESSTTWKEPFK
jgi:hypothetical protein